MVADLTNSSTEDYGLGVDTAGNALIAFLDTREGLSNQQVTAAKMAPSGNALWTRHGVQLTSDSAFHAAPKIVGTSDGSIVVAWTSDSNVVLQKLDANGVAQWGSGIVFSLSGSDYLLADLHAADNGSVIVSWVSNKGFGSNSQLRANKVSSSGSLLWGSSNVDIFDVGSLQFGNFPYFVYDGNGGAVFAWYTSIPTLQCFAQHIRSDGSEAFPHNGVAGSGNTVNVRVSPAAAYSKATDEVFMFWTEEDSNQVLERSLRAEVQLDGHARVGRKRIVHCAPRRRSADFRLDRADGQRRARFLGRHAKLRIIHDTSDAARRLGRDGLRAISSIVGALEQIPPGGGDRPFQHSGSSL